MKVKICGITNLEDALYCQKAGADALGFVFYEKSKRYISPCEAKKINDKLNPFIVKVGVFVNNTAEEINNISKISGINLVQLHGDELPDIVKKINLPVIKAIRIKGKVNMTEIEKWNNVKLLFDTYTEENFGGTGKRFNTNFLPENIYVNSIIAGGINCDNINEILNNNILPAGVDLSSSVEVTPGKKDRKKIDEFFRIIKSKSR